MYIEYKNILVPSTGIVQGVLCGDCTQVQDCISLYTKYKLSMSYDTESPQPDDDLYHVAESLQPYIHTYICNPISVHIVLVELIIPGELENL